ncbi:hypothetical protein [Silvibacterium dinghuense]|uniref:Uncharacterized protein n=1 Tax=Silvibacterium dinghuense TaxID=1560006 RepID=A0A4Q1SJ66_9BACT|nr:hypothetical protein [Silvibacterium dinghuense]RXS97465.1 hypothetical protein ESZ00_06095 [Silvibacterium dinghuense]GGG99248.1 hypothetical protein GCM10011586_13430 [Silvibacterium dinghuense]
MFTLCSRASLTAILLAAILGHAPALSAQQSGAPSLKQILEHLEANLRHYDSSVPSLFCEEHAVSSQTEHNLPEEQTVTGSIFRLRRTAGPGNTTSLVESREIKSVDGKPARSQDIDGPALVSGIFEGGLAVASLEQSGCMDYTLQPPDRKHPGGPYIIRFSTDLTPANSANCFLKEKSKGRVFVDPASMQITHLEILTPRHVMEEGNAFSPRVVGKRDLTVDYAPVLLGSESFWLPSAITMRITRGSDFHPTIWSFQATYVNYHRMEVTTRIVPEGETPQP